MKKSTLVGFFLFITTIKSESLRFLQKEKIITQNPIISINIVSS
ncbi:hypothetical protein IMCC3317_39020 [Kordia antarctica]|uniref:Uncharacterized protein n=1 Tax=Kordia antarctica TaxID=1218801 RepID=A0A7L4ZPV3_9FLAO|nr:hypothetical protein IMCC3317_39020 [Kordia antarctica]